MNDFIEDFFVFLGILIGSIALLIFLIFLIMLPVAWFSGHTNAILLKEKGITMEWYRAAFVPNEYFINANVNISK